MKPLRHFLPAAILGGLLGWGVSRFLFAPQEHAPASVKTAGSAVTGGVLSAGESIAAFRSMVELRAPAPSAEEASGRLLFWDSRKYTQSPARAGLESEVLRSILPIDKVTGNEFLDVRPEGSPGAAELMTRTARVRPAYALAEVDRMLGNSRKDEQEANDLRRRVFREWLRTDAKAALAAALNFNSSIKRGQHLQGLLSEWSRIDPAAAAAAVATFPDSGPGFTKSDFATSLFRDWYPRDPAAARNWAASVTDPGQRAALLSTADELAASTPAARAEVLLASPQPDHFKLANTFATWLTAEPEAAVQKLASIPASDKFWQANAANVAQWWALNARALRTPEQFLETVGTVPAGPRREALLRGL